MTTRPPSLNELCDVMSARATIDVEQLFSNNVMGKFLQTNSAAWHDLSLPREEHESPAAVMIDGTLSIGRSPAHDTVFFIDDVPVNAFDGRTLVLSTTDDYGKLLYVVMANLNPYGCRDESENQILPYVAWVDEKAFKHPLGLVGIARTMICARHFRITAP